MARKEIKCYPGQYYHIYNRGNSKQNIFYEPENYTFFLKRLHFYFDPIKVEICAYCLLPNHFHLLATLADSCNFQRALQRFFISYSKSLNRWRGSAGHIFQGKYQIRHVDTNEYLSQLCRYIHLNPVKAGLSKEPEQWPYSDYKEWITSDGSLNTPAIRLRNSLFGNAKRYKEFLKEGSDFSEEKTSDFSPGKTSDFSLRLDKDRNRKSPLGTDVAVGILRKDGKYLVCQRKRDGRYGLKWEFPGGKLENAETSEQCLRRELREELSIEIQSIERVYTESAYYSDGGVFNVTYCFVSGFDGDPANNVFEQIRWVPLEELRRMDMLEGNKPFIEKLTP